MLQTNTPSETPKRQNLKRLLDLIVALGHIVVGMEGIWLLLGIALPVIISIIGSAAVVYLTAKGHIRTAVIMGLVVVLPLLLVEAALFMRHYTRRLAKAQQKHQANLEAAKQRYQGRLEAARGDALNFLNGLFNSLDLTASNGDPRKLCEVVMESVSKVTRAYTMVGREEGAKRVSVVSFDKKGMADGRFLSGFDPARKNLARARVRSYLSGNKGMAARALDLREVVVVPDARHGMTPSWDVHMDATDKPDAGGRMAAPIEVRLLDHNKALLVTGLGALCLAWDGEPGIDVSRADKTRLREAARGMGFLCDSVRWRYTGGAPCPNCELLSATPGTP